MTLEIRVVQSGSQKEQGGCQSHKSGLPLGYENFLLISAALPEIGSPLY
jgi:hypothetical protein